MPAAFKRIRSILPRRGRAVDVVIGDGASVRGGASHRDGDVRRNDAIACSWLELRRVYEEQARRGVPEAVRGLELIEQDRWPTSGRPR